jgi:hypothetical protein
MIDQIQHLPILSSCRMPRPDQASSPHKAPHLNNAKLVRLVYQSRAAYLTTERASDSCVRKPHGALDMFLSSVGTKVGGTRHAWWLGKNWEGSRWRVDKRRKKRGVNSWLLVGSLLYYASFLCEDYKRQTPCPNSRYPCKTSKKRSKLMSLLSRSNGVLHDKHT